MTVGESYSRALEQGPLHVTCLVARLEAMEAPVRRLQLIQPVGQQQLVRRRRRRQEVVGSHGRRYVLGRRSRLLVGGHVDQVRHDVH